MSEREREREREKERERERERKRVKAGSAVVAKYYSSLRRMRASTSRAMAYMPLLYNLYLNLYLTADNNTHEHIHSPVKAGRRAKARKEQKRMSK